MKYLKGYKAVLVLSCVLVTLLVTGFARSYIGAGSMHWGSATGDSATITSLTAPTAAMTTATVTTGNITTGNITTGNIGTLAVGNGTAISGIFLDSETFTDAETTSHIITNAAMTTNSKLFISITDDSAPNAAVVGYSIAGTTATVTVSADPGETATIKTLIVN